MKLLSLKEMACWVMPLFAFAWGLWGLLSGRGGTLWGLPATFWYCMWIITALLLLVTTFLSEEK